MAAPTPDRGGDARLVEVVVADHPDAWAAAGFTVVDDRVHLGPTALRLTGRHGDGGTGITRWAVAGLDPDVGDLDGLPTDHVDRPDDPPPGPAHPNGVTGLDHVVVATGDLDRTIAAFGRAGLACRRLRDATAGGAPVRQAFFRLGPAIVEVVGGTEADGAPAGWFGLALDATDLATTAAVLGDHLGPTKAAVQAGRRIATFRHRALGLSVAVAAMDHHGDR